MNNRRRMLLQSSGGGSPLPAGYTQVKAIQGGGTAGILLDIPWVTDSNCDYIYEGIKPNANHGSPTSWYYGNTIMGVLYSYGRIQFCISGHQGSIVKTIATSGYNKLIRIDYFNMHLIGKVDGVITIEEDITGTAKSEQKKYGIFVWGYSWNKYDTQIILRLYLAKEGTIAFDLYPCTEDATGSAGFYDVANSRFLTCDGLIARNDV